MGKSTQLNYESGKSYPDARYLVSLDSLGFDVLYILTGARSTEAMTAEHQNLIEAYEAAPEPIRRAVFAALLSPYKSEWDKARLVPGYFRAEILGEDDVRYGTYREGKKAPPKE